MADGAAPGSVTVVDSRQRSAAAATPDSRRRCDESLKFRDESRLTLFERDLGLQCRRMTVADIPPGCRNISILRGHIMSQLALSVKRFIVSEDGPTAVEYA